MHSIFKSVVTAILCVLLVVSAPAATLTVTKPEEVGFSTERLRRIRTAVQNHITAKDFGGAVTLVARRGKVVHFEAQGVMDVATGTPMSTDALFRLASMTKPITAVAVLMMMEEGKLTLNDPISKYIPEFKNPKVATWNLPNDPRGMGLRLLPADREMTIQHILTHTAGMAVSADGPAGAEFAKADLNGPSIGLAEYSRRVGALPLNFQPGTQWQYTGGVGFSILGRVVEIVSGMNLEQFFKQRIFTPLGMNNTFFTIPKDRMGLLAEVNQLVNGGLTKRDAPATPAPGVEYFAGAGGLTGTAEDYFKFSQMLLSGGQLNGVRILSRKSVEMMADNAIGDLRLSNYPEPGQNLKGYGFGLGVRVRISNAESGWLGSVGDYGWAGANGTYFWIDPKEQIVGIILMSTRVGILRTEFPNAVYQSLVD